MIEITISDEMYRIAKDYINYRDNLREQHPCTKFDPPEDNYIGKLGELSFEIFSNQ